MSNRESFQLIRNTPEPSLTSLVISKLLSCAIPIAQIAVGAVYLDDCPLQPYIPIYLIVCGTFTLMLGLLSCLPCAKKPEDGTTNPLYSVCSIWNLLVSLFLFAWFIAGNVWIYSIYEPNYNKNSTSVAPYCDKTLYLFAFWTTTVGYIIIGSFLFLCCCCLLCCRACLPTETANV
ncbi:transmembrane protein 272-like [Amphiprion ocellaris]|uniref:Uncharacterized protein n=1 Tax=Amphiprion ocellaris TaxID=80972 RepID=A0AAQ5Y9Y7_AMPOC|nr:transmembrane protein 272-like [Amphiprion ocellaris]XP_054863455.1 transmembrane protein 272-like [Amphiprion ocellaris]